jgi:hypothetical protein
MKGQFENGEKHPYKNKTWDEIYSPEVAARMRARLKNNNPGFKKGKDNYNNTDGPWNKGQKLSDTHKENLRGPRPSLQKENNPFYGKHHNEKTKNQIRKSVLNNLSKCVDFSNRRPNYLERQLGEILDKLYPGEFRYVGGGEVIIGGKIPDFINCNGKKLIIELFGNHWHEPNDEPERKAIFSEYGYETLVIWGNEMKDLIQVENKINNFIGGMNL